MKPMDSEAARTELDQEILDLRSQVLDNCHRSDARHAGFFSMCGLLLRLRDLCKWEMGCPPWKEIDPPLVLSWIEDRESKWESLLEEEIAPLWWRQNQVDPFDQVTINRDLAPSGLFYGAGLAAFMKPSFFLARVIREETLGDCRVIYLGEELARDLYTAPALTRDNVILARKWPLAAYLWEIIFSGGASRRRALETALNQYGLAIRDFNQPAELWTARFESMLEAEIEGHVRHEFGELTDNVFPRDEWRRIVGAYPHTRLELMARTVKDILADSGDKGRLDFIIKEQRLGTLGIFLAQHDGLAARVFPEIIEAFELFQRYGDWMIIEEARQKGKAVAARLARKMIELVNLARGRPEEWLAGRVDSIFYQPLGL